MFVYRSGEEVVADEEASHSSSESEASVEEVHSDTRVGV